jgi:hypothetical protein
MRLTTLNDAYAAYLKKYDTPHNDFHINLVRIFVGLFFAWKVMSRDFGFMGIVPSDFFYYYPIELYHPENIVLVTGVPILMELVTFHWIHWFTGFPSETVLNWLQFLLAGFGVAMAVFGRGAYRALAIAAYVLATYLWGFIFLSGQEIDSVMIYFGMLLVLCLVDYDDRPVWRLGGLAHKPANVAAGRAFSAILLVFVLYYGLSGYNKIADLSIADWFRYNLVQDIEVTLRRQELGNYFGAAFPSLFAPLVGHTRLNYILVPLVYISHISVFYMFFKRRHILKFALFYTGFHFVTSSVSITFTGYMIVWWILLDWRRIVLRLSRRDPAVVPV